MNDAPTSLEEFRDQVKDRIDAMNRVLEHPDDTWPGALFVQHDGLPLELAGLYSLAGIDEAQKQYLARVLLPARLRVTGASRFGLALPSYGPERPEPVEYLTLIVGDAGGATARLAPVIRSAHELPQLGPWSEQATSVSGLFVEPLLAELRLERPRDAQAVADEWASSGLTL
jgi:hypothetical protein